MLTIPITAPVSVWYRGVAAVTRVGGGIELEDIVGRTQATDLCRIQLTGGIGLQGNGRYRTNNPMMRYRMEAEDGTQWEAGKGVLLSLTDPGRLAQG